MTQLLHPYMRVHDRDVFGERPERSSPAVQFDSPHDTPSLLDPAESHDHDLDERHVHGFEDAVRQLFHMTLASLRGYREIAHLTTHPELHTLLEVLVHQRAAQCRALAQMSHSLYRQLGKLGPDDESLTDPAAADLQVIWLRAIWSFEQEEFGRFADNTEQAESILEDALLGAANSFKNAGASVLCRQFAMSVCGARQRLEELTDSLVVNR